MKIFSSRLPFWLFIFFAAGIILGYFYLMFLLFLILGFAAAAGVILFCRKQKILISDLFIILMIISLGGVWVIPAVKRNQAMDNIVMARGAAPLRIKVITLPQEKSTGNVCYAKVKPFNQKVRVMDYTRSLEYLNSYEVEGKLNRRNYQGRDFYTLGIKKAAKVKQLPQSFWDRHTRKTTDYLLSVFKNNLSEQGYRFMCSILLGRREVLGEEKQILTDSGMAHLLALSGLHLGMVALIVFFILKLFYLPFKKCLIVSVLFLLFYTLLTGMAWPTLRAAVMYSFFAAGFFMKRRTNLLNSLGLAGLCALIIEPLALFEAGFQLSYLAVFALIIWSKIFPIKVFKNQFFNYVQGLFFCSFSVTLFLTPLVSYYFGRIYFFSVLYNLVLIPAFTFLLTVGFMLIVFSSLGFVAQSIGSILSWGISGFVFLSRILSSFRFAYFEYRFSFSMVGIYYVFLAAGLIVIWRYRKIKGIVLRDY